jgi:tryptophan-rich sensory protein
LGSLATTLGVSSEWYSQMQKAPWTPPGWVFGAAWTTIMICFGFYMAKAISLLKNSKSSLVLYVIQWILNVLWNPLFFHYHMVFTALLTISCLSVLISYLLIKNLNTLKYWSLLIMPYFVWMWIATSLNFYIWLYN